MYLYMCGNALQHRGTCASQGCSTAPLLSCKPRGAARHLVHRPTPKPFSKRPGACLDTCITEIQIHHVSGEHCSIAYSGLHTGVPRHSCASGRALLSQLGHTVSALKMASTSQGSLCTVGSSQVMHQLWGDHRLHCVANRALCSWPSGPGGSPLGYRLLCCSGAA